MGRTNTIYPLPGGLDETPLVISNHPELLLGPGIAVSTLPGPGEAHLDLALAGEFCLFAHHQNRAGKPLRQVLVACNAGPETAMVAISRAACFTTTEAPYRDRSGSGPSGPGAAVADAMLRPQPPGVPVTIPPAGLVTLHARVVAPGDEITTQMALHASGPVYAALLFLEASQEAETVLRAARRLPADPAALAPSRPGAPGSLIYGRAAGVQSGACWRGTIAAGATATSYLLAGKFGRTEGTGQDQAAPMLRRYPDAAYAAHGNYGVLYDLRLVLPPTPLQLYFDTPPDPALPAAGPLLTLRRRVGLATPRLAFRGTLEVTPPGGKPRCIYISQDFGERVPRPLLETPPSSGELRLRFYYPANATPPHLLVSERWQS